VASTASCGILRILSAQHVACGVPVFAGFFLQQEVMIKFILGLGLSVVSWNASASNAAVPSHAAVFHAASRYRRP
jgi:hypothetical protein